MLGSNFKQSAAWLFSNGALMFINSYVDVDVDVDNFHRFFKMHFRLFKLKRDGQSTGEQWKKLWLFRAYRGVLVLPSYVGIIS